MWHKKLEPMKEKTSYLLETYAVPMAKRFIEWLDLSVRFISSRNYQSSNPAIAATRAPLVVGLWVLLALACIMLVWGVFVPIESAATARGSVTLMSNKKTIQHLEGGIIEKLYVKEGD